jgi:hypothetical protein
MKKATGFLLSPLVMTVCGVTMLHSQMAFAESNTTRMVAPREVGSGLDTGINMQAVREKSIEYGMEKILEKMPKIADDCEHYTSNADGVHCQGHYNYQTRGGGSNLIDGPLGTFDV